MTQRDAFNNQVKKIDKGYKIPEGPMVSWNEIALHFKSLVSERANSTKISKKENNLARQDTLSINFTAEYQKTKLGQVFEGFSPYLECAIIDGRIGLFERGGSAAEKVSQIAFPNTLRHHSSEGHYLSSSELKRVLREYHIDFASKDEDLQQGYEQFSGILDTILTKCTDYSAAGVMPVNRPVPQDRLENTPVQRYQASQPKYLRGGGMRECM
ncbi:MAG: hypothetical protein ACQEQL_05320 [Pseudomonadota bacterium]